MGFLMGPEGGGPSRPRCEQAWCLLRPAHPLSSLQLTAPARGLFRVPTPCPGALTTVWLGVGLALEPSFNPNTPFKSLSPRTIPWGSGCPRMDSEAHSSVYNTHQRELGVACEESRVGRSVRRGAWERRAGDIQPGPSPEVEPLTWLGAPCDEAFSGMQRPGGRDSCPSLLMASCVSWQPSEEFHAGDREPRGGLPKPRCPLVQVPNHLLYHLGPHQLRAGVQRLHLPGPAGVLPGQRVLSGAQGPAAAGESAPLPVESHPTDPAGRHRLPTTVPGQD